MPLAIHAIVITLSGLYTSLWGAFKDSPYETFKPKTFPRSIYFSWAIWAMLWMYPLTRQAVEKLGMVQLFFVVMGLERFITELYKLFFRTEDQTKYFIPSRITFFGRHVSSNGLRYTAGTVLVLATLSVTLLPQMMKTWWQFALVAYAAGSVVALGGAYKDAPFEGFDPIKFQRSSLVLLCFSPLFYLLGPVQLGMLIFMYGGLERFLVEYYKTYIQRNMSGKFQPDTQRIQQYLDNREKFHYAAWLIIVVVAVTFTHEVGWW